MAEVLLVSKPVVPPWHDSSKNLVRDLARALPPRHRAHVMVPWGAAPDLGPAVHQPLYRSISADARAGFSPAVSDNLRVLSRLAIGRRLSLWHFFFAPNPRSSLAARAVSRVRRVPTVQTVCSIPRDDDALGRLLFGDRVVVLSQHTEARCLAAGIAAERLRRIPPAVRMPTPEAGGRQAVRRRLGLPADAPLLLFAGDLEFGGGAGRSLATLRALPRSLDAVLVFACREKTPAARAHALSLQRTVAEAGLEQRVRFVGETSDIHAYLQAADVVLMPSDTTYAKMDLPLVLIEAMALGRAVVVGDGTAAAELSLDGGAVACALETDALAETVGRLLHDTAARAALGERAARVARARYSPAPMAEAYAQLYDALC